MFENNPIQESIRQQLETTLFLHRKDSKAEFSFPFPPSPPCPPSSLNHSALPIIKTFASAKQMSYPLNFLRDKEKECNVCALEDMDCIWRRREAQHTIMDRLFELVKSSCFVSLRGSKFLWFLQWARFVGFFLLAFFFEVRNAAGIAPLNPGLCKEERTGLSIVGSIIWNLVTGPESISWSQEHSRRL